MTKTRIGFVGAGIIAHRHLGDLLQFPDVQVVAFADPAAERARELAGQCDAKVYDDHRAMLDGEKLDALYICVPPFAHGAPELAAVERSLPFFVEKPLAVDWQTAATVGRAVAEQNLVTATGYHWRYLDLTERVQEMVSKNPARLALGYWMDFTPPPPWWIHQAQSGGQFVEQTTHIFDLARLLVGDVTRVYAAGSRTERPAYPESDIFDVSVATLHFASGALGSMASTCVLNWPHRIALHLFCEGLAIEMSEFELMVDVGKGRPVQKAQGDPFMREDRDFVDAVQGKTNRIRAPYAEALKTHRVVTACSRAAHAGQALDVETD